MNGWLDRQLVTHAVTALALCIGGWTVLAAPQAQELRELETSVAHAKDSVATVNQESIEDLARQMQGVRQRVREIAAQNRFVTDSGQMYSTIKSRAESEAVALTRIVPGTPVTAQDDASVQSVTFDLTVEGRYEQVTAFLRALDGTGGFLRPLRLKITPIGDGTASLVRCEAGFQSFCFAMPQALKPLAG